MFMLLFFLGTYFQSRIDTEKSTVVANYFGFEIGGSFNITVKNVEIKPILLQVCSSEEYTSLTTGNISRTCSQYSEICKKSYTSLPDQNTSYYADSINEGDKEGRYYSVITMCDATESHYDLYITMRNKDSLLSTELRPCLFIFPIFLALYGLGLFYWVINWIKNYKATNSLHLFYSVIFVFAFIAALINTIYYAHYDKSDTNAGIIEAHILFNLFFEILLIAGLLFLSRGFGIIHNNFTKCQIVETVFSSALVCTTVETMNYDESFLFKLFMVIAFTISFIYMFKLVLAGVKDAIIHVYAHMIVIAEMGINPMTTPILSTLRIYRNITYIVIVYFLIDLLVQISSSYLEISGWIPELITNASNTILIYGAIIMFRLNPKRAAGYENISETNTREFTAEEIESTDVESLIKNATEPWDGVTPLPAQPRIVDKKVDDTEEIVDAL